MHVSRPLVAVASSLALFGALWIPNAQIMRPKDPAPFKPVVKVSSLMTGLGGAAGKIQEAYRSEEEHRLKSLAAWSDVIAELSNVHMQHRRKPDYLEMADSTRTIALELASAARADVVDEMQLATLMANLDTSCGTCHDADK